MVLPNAPTLFILLFIICLLISSAGKSDSSTLTQLNGKSKIHRDTIQRLRNAGLEKLQKKNYEAASDYYAAILQLVEGVGGDYATDMRRRCGLTLTECELKCHRYDHAVARASEIIAEFTEIADLDREKHLTSKTLAIAHLRRGLAFKYLQKPKWYQTEILRASKCQPQDDKIKAHIVGLKKKKKKRLNSCVDSMMEDFIDQCICSCPRELWTQAAIQQLLSTSKSAAQPFLSKKVSSSHRYFGTNLMNFMDSESSVRTIAMLTGMSEKSVKTIFSVVKVTSAILNSLRKLSVLIARNKDVVIITLSFGWLLSTLIKQYWAK
jgi:hypothetical protein